MRCTLIEAANEKDRKLLNFKKIHLNEMGNPEFT